MPDAAPSKNMLCTYCRQRPPELGSILCWVCMHNPGSGKEWQLPADAQRLKTPFAEHLERDLQVIADIEKPAKTCFVCHEPTNPNRVICEGCKELARESRDVIVHPRVICRIRDHGGRVSPHVLVIDPLHVTAVLMTELFSQEDDRSHPVTNVHLAGGQSYYVDDPDRTVVDAIWRAKYNR